MRIRLLPVVAGLLVAASAAWAHHSFDAEFDRNQVVNLVGTVIRMEWVNPHTMLHVAVTNDDGTVTEWMIEGNTPNSLLRAGLTKASLKKGTELIIRGYRARSGDNIASAAAILFKDGKSLSLSSDKGAPVLDWTAADQELWKLQLEALNRNQ